MALGFRLGPVRLGVSSRGHVTGGITVGPVSASTRIGGNSRNGQYPIWPETADQLVTQAQTEGWQVVSRGDWFVRVERGLRAAVITTVQGGTQIRPALSSLATWLIAAVLIVPVLTFSVLSMFFAS